MNFGTESRALSNVPNVDARNSKDAILQKGAGMYKIGPTFNTLNFQ